MLSNFKSDINLDLVKSSINTIIVAKSIYYFDELESTNEYAKELAEKGESEGTVVLADHQRSGKGRLERKWFSPKEVNLYISIILRPNINIRDVNILTFISSISTVNTISKYGIESDIKWPNDVVFQGKKISGVLTEINSNKDLLDYVVVGIGINVNLTKQHIKEYENLSEKATSLYIESGFLINRNEFLVNFLTNIDRTYIEYSNHGKGHIIEQWLERWKGFNRKVKVTLDKDSFNGKCKGIDEYGYLIVEKSNGESFTVFSGDVILIDN